MINYDIIHKSIVHYEGYGFVRVEAPWYVNRFVSDITKPPHGTDFGLDNGNQVLVASGEQSFLELYLHNYLPKGQFQAVTPCFRDERVDFLHSKYFIKNELIKTDATTPDDLGKVINSAVRFYEQYVNGVNVVEVGKNQFDIYFKEVELGSYGIRNCDFLTWIYGTGVAEPRLSQVMNKYGLPYPKDTKRESWKD
jgi:hypothetical protein